MTRRLFASLSLTTLAGLVLGPWRAKAAVVKPKTIADVIDAGDPHIITRTLLAIRGTHQRGVYHNGMRWWASSMSSKAIHDAPSTVIPWFIAMTSERWPDIPLASEVLVPAPPPSAGQ